MFAYEVAVTERYPALRAGLLHATGLVNGSSPPALLDEYRTEQRATAERLATTTVADLPSIAAWRRAFAQFGVDPTRHRSAPEGLLRRLAKRGDIPSISTLVDIGNLVSIRHALPVAVFDLQHVAGSITVRFATGDEWFTDLGSSDGVHPDQGEVVFVDRKDVVMGTTLVLATEPAGRHQRHHRRRAVRRRGPPRQGRPRHRLGVGRSHQSPRHTPASASSRAVRAFRHGPRGLKRKATNAAAKTTRAWTRTRAIDAFNSYDGGIRPTGIRSDVG